MAKGIPILPTSCNTDIANDSLPPSIVRLIKNLTLKKGANGNPYDLLGNNEDTLKPLQANEIYSALTGVPDGERHCIGAPYFPVVNRVYCFVWNSLGNHFIYRINCDDATMEIVKIDSTFNFKLQPEYFINVNNCHLEPVRIIDPITQEEVIKEDLYFNDGLNYPRYIRVNDCIATDGFNKSRFPYFKGNYDENILISMGLPSLDDCINVVEVPITATDTQLNNDLLYQTWKFRAKATDVYGRPSEHGIIAFYIPGINDCLADSNNISRCLNLIIKVDNPLIDTVDIEYLTGTGTIWHKSATVQLYVGDRINWWTRKRNPNVIFDTNTFELTHVFCADAEHEAIPVDETSRLYNPVPKAAQVIVKLNKRLGLANNLDGFNPIDTETLQKIKFNIEKPVVTDTELVSITVYVPIYNLYQNEFGSVYGNASEGYVFGGNYVKNGETVYYFPRPYMQYFTNIAQTGFIGYLNDGDSVISTQVYLDANGNLVDDPNHQGLFLSPRRFTMQKFTFTNKKKGHYIFRLASHLTDQVVTPDYQKTSTLVWGLCSYTKPLTGFDPRLIDRSRTKNTQEILINCCGGSYDTLTDSQILMILDVSNDNEKQKVTCGYINETTNNGVPALPVELMKVNNNNGFVSLITDHNGFYYYGTQGTGRGFDFNFNYKCKDTQFTLGETDRGVTTFRNFTLDGIIPDGSIVAKYPDYATEPCHRVIVKGKIVLSGTNIGVSNALVTISRGGYAITDGNGEYSIVVHDDMWNFATGRKDQLVFSTVCLYHEVNSDCISNKAVNIIPCSTCILREQTVLDWTLIYDNFRGLLSGGSYPVGICMADWLGRRNYIQDLGVLKIPTVAETGMTAPCKVKIDIAAGVTFPDYFKWATFWIGEEMTNADYLEWIIDKVEFIDIRGQLNNVNPTQIRIWYSSLNEYNKQNNFSTTCAWQFLVQDTTNPVVGDKVQFIINGDGAIFNTSLVSLVKYDQNGQYFLVDYKPVLKDLQAFGKIRLAHPKQSFSEKQAFYEICDSRINLVNGVPDRRSFYFNAFDTYYLNREIPVPTSLNNLTEQITNTVATQNRDITNTVAVTTTQPVAYANQLKTVGYYFEHHSPSNFWGLHCWNNGRVNIKNNEEAEQINYNKVILTGELLSTGVLSYLNYFDTRLETNFEIPNTGGIVGALVMPGRVLWITQHYNFLTGYNDNLLRQQDDGTISSNGTGFGQPTTLADYKYGCQIRDKNTISITQDRIAFVDSNNGEAIVLIPGAQSIRLTKNKHDILFTAKIKSMVGTNRYFTSVINPLTDEYLITDFNLDEKTYVNKERYYNTEANETLSFDINTGEFLGQFSFTPEMYAAASGDLLHKQLFSFKNAIPYRHYDINENQLFNVFYGEPVERVLVFVYNIDKTLVKSLKWIEVYSKFLYWAFLITTETNQKSRLTIGQWVRGNKFYKASFLCDMNTPDVNNQITNKLFDGNLLQGRYATIHLVGQEVNNKQYSELAGVLVFGVPVEKSGV